MSQSSQTPPVSTDQRPLVSVILTTHNRASLLPRAIRSVLGQTYSHLELIVVDDCSTDDTAAAVAQFADSRLTYVRTDRNVRVSAARNLGLSHAHGALIAYHDDDDIWLVQKLERQVAHLLGSGPEVGLSICGHIAEYREHAAYVGGSAHLSDLDFVSGISKGAALTATPGWLVRREHLEKTGGFDEEMPCWVDWELAMRLADVCRIAHLDEPLFLQDQTRASGSGIGDNLLVHAQAFRRLYDRHRQRWPSPRQQSRLMFAVGNNLAMFGELNEGRRWLRRAVATDPLNAKAWVSLALTLLGDSVLKRVTLRLRRARLGWKRRSFA